MRFSLAQIVALMLCLGVIVGLSPTVPAAAAEFTSEQRQVIETIVRDYLTKHPEVMLDALQAAEDKIKSESRDKASAALVTRRHEVLDDPDTPIGGNPKGDVSLVEFFDYRCPYCKQVEPALEAMIKDDPKLRIVYKEYPVLGAESMYASKMALAARKQGKYGAFHDAMMAAKGQINDQVVLDVAKSAGVDVARAKVDMDAPDIQDIVKRNYALAEALDIQGTPAFVIGDTLVPGAIDIDSLRKLVADARHPG